MAEGNEPNPNGTITQSTASVSSTYGTSNLTLYRSGNVITMIGYIDITTAVPSYTNFLTTPTGWSGYARSIYAHKDNNIFWLFGGASFSPQTGTLATGRYYFNETWIYAS